MMDRIDELILQSVQKQVSNEVDDLIQRKVDAFSRELLDRKDDYIAQIMKGIRLYHEQSPIENSMNYKIVFQNEYRINTDKWGGI